MIRIAVTDPYMKYDENEETDIHSGRNFDEYRQRKTAESHRREFGNLRGWSAGMPRLRRHGTEDEDHRAVTYQCELCHQVSTSEAPQKETPITSCPVCGASGAAFKVIQDNGATVRYRCMMCNHETDSVKG